MLPTQKRRTDYTEGPVFRAILKMGLPSMFGFLSENIYNLVDTFWVSRLPDGESGVAALTFLGTILWLFFTFNQLVGPGSVAVISRRYGEKLYDQVEKAIKETIILKLFFGGLLGLCGFFLVEYMLDLLGAEPKALEMGVRYGRVMFIGMPIFYATYSIYTGMRSVANPHMAMFLMIGSNILNLLLDPLLIFGYLGFPELGIRGAAVASVLSFVITFGVGLALFYGDFTNVRLHVIGKAGISLPSMLKILRIGVPAWFGEMSFSSSRLIITPLIAAFGTSVVAAYGIGNRVTHFGIMVLVGIGLGLSSLIGHTIGGGKLERAKKTANHAILLGTGIMCFAGIASFIFARWIMGVFFEEAETIGYGVVMLRILALSFPFLGAFLMLEQIHLGVGLNTPAMVMNIVHAWALEAVPIYLLTKVLGFDETAIWWTICASILLTASAFYIYYRRGRWLTVKV